MEQTHTTRSLKRASGLPHKGDLGAFFMSWILRTYILVVYAAFGILIGVALAGAFLGAR